MYTNSAYWHQTRLDFKDKKHPIFIGSCGTYRLYTIKKLPTHRPRGRLDYQLLYVASGKAHFYFDGKEEIVSAGNMVCTVQKKNSATTIMVPTIRKCTGFILLGITSKYPPQIRHCRWRSCDLFRSLHGIQASVHEHD